MSSNTTAEQIEEMLARPGAPRRVTTLRAPSLTLKGLTGDFFKLVQYRDLLYTLSVHRIKVRYKQSVLGAAWAILQPLSLMLIYTLIFSLIVRMPTGGTPYAVFAYAALLPWTFFSTALVNATNGLVTHAQLITKVYFPREILPLTYVIASLFDFLIASTVFAGLMLYYHVALTMRALYVLPIILILTCFVTAISLFFSATQVRFRDIGVAMPLLLQLWMFATPVVYPLSAVPARLQAVYKLNPMVGLIENFRQVTLYGASPDLTLLGLSTLISVLLLVAAYVYFKRVEATVADVI
ncbi:MAG TPA: ABC transporter permease [Pyrinomonadaceae bacterium]|jgi:lipopolysaccharide transport system permease protein|nr:ABC transporter permease [Pyrinomonadaceae bacterium]